MSSGNDNAGKINPWLDDEDELLGAAFAVHPGLILKNDVLPNLRVSGSELADAIHSARPGITNMLNGKRPVTPDLAVKIEAAIGYPAQILSNLQAEFDLLRARETADLSHVDRLVAA